MYCHLGLSNSHLLPCIADCCCLCRCRCTPMPARRKRLPSRAVRRKLSCSGSRQTWRCGRAISKVRSRAHRCLVVYRLQRRGARHKMCHIWCCPLAPLLGGQGCSACSRMFSPTAEPPCVCSCLAGALLQSASRCLLIWLAAGLAVRQTRVLASASGARTPQGEQAAVKVSCPPGVFRRLPGAFLGTQAPTCMLSN